MLLDTMIAELQGELAVLPDYMSGAFLNGLFDGVAIAAKAADDYSAVCTLHDATDECLGRTARYATFCSDSSMSDYAAGIDLAYGYAREIAGESIYDDDHTPSRKRHAGDLLLPDGTVLSVDVCGDRTRLKVITQDDAESYPTRCSAADRFRAAAARRFTLTPKQSAALLG